MEKLKKSGILRIISGLFFIAAQAVMLFFCAGRTDIPRAWIYVGASLAIPLIGILIMFKYCPHTIELINQRGKIQEGTKTWDRILTISLLPVWFFIPIIAGLDLGRFHWSNLSIYFVIPGVMLTILGYTIVYWAMMVNKYFETTVRIQRERGHHVISTGPYKYVRHPGYAGSILSLIATPLILGSVYIYIPIGVLILMVIIRTVLEDRILKSELDGYEEYAKRVKYRLLPNAW